MTKIIPQRRALVLVSGGTASAELTAQAYDQYDEIKLLHISWGEPILPKAVQDLATDFEVELIHRTVPDGIVMGHVQWIEAGTPDYPEYQLKQSQGTGYTPGRNLIMFGVATNVATLEECGHIILGFQDTDAKTFPDRGGLFLDRMKQAVSLSVGSPNTERLVQVHFPLRDVG